MAGAIVQSVYVVDDTGVASLTIAGTITGVATGATLAVHVGWEDVAGTTTVSGVNDGTAFATADSKSRDTLNLQGGMVWYLKNAASGSHAVTATLNASESFRRLRIVEISGLDTTAPLDQATGQFQGTPGTGTDNVSSGASSATTNANDFVVGFSQDTAEADPGTGTVTAGTGYTISGTNIIMVLESKNVAATGAQTATFTQNTNNNRITHVVAFKQTGGASGAISGTAALTFGQSGTLTGAGALAGSAPLTFGQTGLLKGTGVLAGSTALTFGQSGALTGAGALAGSSALTFGQSGSLTGAGALAGSAVLTFGATGTLDQPSGALAGTASLTFSQSGTLTGAGQLAGTASFAFGAFATADQPFVGGSNLGGGGGAGKHHDGWSGKFEFKKTPRKVLQLPRKIAEDARTIVEVASTIAATQDSIAVHEPDDDEEAILLLLH